LYRETTNALIYKKFSTAEADQAFVIEMATTAKIANNLFNLPDVLKRVEESLAERAAQIEAAKRANQADISVFPKGRKSDA